MGVVTAITVQDTAGVADFLSIDAVWVADQARAVLEDMPVAAIKLGMLGSAENIAAIAEVLSDYPNVPVVLDPVLASGRGDELASEAMIDFLRVLLLPQTTLITPNSLEARRLAAAEDDLDEIDLSTCADRLIELGCQYALITGAHERTAEVKNVLYNRQGPLQTLHWARLPGAYHGSGCTLASAIAAYLAHGLSIEAASESGQRYTHATLRHAYRPGMGQSIPERLFRLRAEDRA